MAMISCKNGYLFFDHICIDKTIFRSANLVEMDDPNYGKDAYIEVICKDGDIRMIYRVEYTTTEEAKADLEKLFEVLSGETPRNKQSDIWERTGTMSEEATGDEEEQ